MIIRGEITEIFCMADDCRKFFVVKENNQDMFGSQ